MGNPPCDTNEVASNWNRLRQLPIPKDSADYGIEEPSRDLYPTNHGSTVATMRETQIVVPSEVVDLHSHLDVTMVIRARLDGLDLPNNGFGFFSWNEENSFFTQLSRMIDYGGYGVHKIVRKVQNGTDVDKAIDLVAGYWGCGETEVPHIESVIHMTPDLPCWPRMGIEFARSPNSTFYKDSHNVDVDAILVVDVDINGKKATLESADGRFLDFWDWHRRRLPRHV